MTAKPDRCTNCGRVVEDHDDRGRCLDVDARWNSATNRAAREASAAPVRPWEQVAPGEWWAMPPRQLTGKPYLYHGYVTRDRKRAERPCHEGDHRSPEAARRCAERTARRLNRGLN